DQEMSSESNENFLGVTHLLALEQSTHVKNGDTYRTLIEAIGEAGGVLALNRLLALEQLTHVKNGDTYRTLIEAIGKVSHIS
ncbi:hypothetical protein, partial [Acinetobacter johnsonii]|uniref:hypothetical protein n=1 Tax=Acinetobacter johnsonii TaxID=40214 RepID=UPI0030161F91